MTDRLPGTVKLRDVVESDLPVFFEHQRDPVATEMAAFPSRDRKTFMKHWARLLDDDEIVARTILFDGEVAGNIVSAVYSDNREVGYWLGRNFWGNGVATCALATLLHEVTTRPLYAHVSRANPASIRVLEKNGFRTAREQRNLLLMKLDDVPESSYPATADL